LLELIKDYDLGINYHPGKANVVVNALSRRSHVRQLKMERKRNIKEKKSLRFAKDDQGVLWYQGRIYVPDVKGLKGKILREAHNSAYSIHPGGNKMYHDLKATYWWYGMKRDIVEYVALCDTCQRVEIEHQ
jgi:hypothetical protein